MKFISLFFLLLVSTSLILTMAQEKKTTLKEVDRNQRNGESQELLHRRTKKHLIDVPRVCPPN